MKRHEQKIEDTWDLAKMYNEDNLEYDIQSCFEQVKKIQIYQHVDFDKETIVDALELYYKLLIDIENIYVYFSHTVDVDYGNDKTIAKFNRIKQDYNKMMVDLSFLIPKISECDNSILQEILNDNDKVDYHKAIRNIINNKKRYLSEEQEKIISTYNLNGSAAYQLFSAFTNSDMKFDSIADKDGAKHEVTEGTYATYIRSKDRVLRKNAFESLLGQYSKYNQTLATNYITELKDSLISMKNRAYDSTLQQALEPNQIPEYVYTNLLTSVEDNINVNHEYIKLRKEEMKLDDLNLYDVYVSMVSDVDKKYSFEQGAKLIKEALNVFPVEYQNILEQALNERWIDKYENEGKRSGAYSGGSYKSVPYMLLNYHNDINDVFTLAHELGHSMHSYFANENNPYQNANYKIFIAEVASTVNELLLINYLLGVEDNKNIRKYLYNYLLEQFRTTMIRQTMFARFELESHKLVEENKEISNAVLNELYLDINKQYFGNDVIVNDLIKYEWSRIPHFYYNYYVYQYATSFSISINIVDRILANEKGIIDKYMSFLKAGDSVYPIEALKLVDIDLSNKDIFNAAMERYNKTIELYRNVK